MTADVTPEVLPPVASPEVVALRKVAADWHQVFEILSNATIPGGKWLVARDLLALADGAVQSAEKAVLDQLAKEEKH